MANKFGIVVFLFMVFVFGVLASFSLYGMLEHKFYYQKLYDSCITKTDCCSDSIDHMKESGYEPAIDKVCPEGYTVKSLDCYDSFAWCEPVE